MNNFIFDIQRFAENITLTEGDDTYKTNTSLDGATILALGGNDTVSNGYPVNTHRYVIGGSNVLIDGGTGDDAIYNYYSDNVSINGGAGNDSIYSYQSNKVSINGGTGNDYIDNYSNNVSIDGGNGHDNIYSIGDNVTINGGASNDSIDNRGSNASISGGAGDDSIDSYWGSNVTIDSGAGDDTIKNNGDNASISGGAGIDSINSRGENVTISGGAGIDHIVLDKSATGNVIRYAKGDGNDSVFGFNADDTLEITSGDFVTATSGEDFIVKVGTGSITFKNHANFKMAIKDSTGNIKIYNENASNIMRGTSNKDELINNHDDATILALGGDDSIYNEGSNVSIDGGVGNDSIYNEGANVLIAGGDGNDSIYNYYGENVTIAGGDGDDSILDNGDKSFIDGGAGNDSIITSEYTGGFLTLNGGIGNDYVNNESSENVIIDGGEGDDEIGNGGANVSIDGGLGNDSIYNGGSNVSIDGGLGNDYIFNEWGENVIIDGGAGDDSIENNDGNILILYKPGDGNDLIEGFNENSIISIGGSVNDYSTLKSGEDIIITVGDNKVTLKSAASLSAVNIVSIDDKSALLITGTKDADSIQNKLINATIDALAGDDSIENQGSNVSINGGDGDDTIYGIGYNTTIDSGDGDDSIKHYGDNALIDGGEGNDLITIDEWSYNVSISGGDGNDSIDNRGSNSTINGGTGNDSIENYGDNSTINGGAGDDYISVDGENFTISGGEGNDSIDMQYSTNAVVKYTEGDGSDTIHGFNATSTLKISGNTYSTIKSGSDIIVQVGDGSVLLKDAATLSTVNIEYIMKNPLLIVGTEDADTINNDLDGATIQALSGDDSIKNIAPNTFINGGDGNNYIQNIHGTKFVLDDSESEPVTVDGEIILQNVTLLIVDSAGDKSTIETGFGNDTIYNNCDSVSINSGAGNDSIDSYWGSNVTIDGGDGHDNIYSIGDNVTINGGADNDFIVNYYGSNVSIDGGNGNDSISIGKNFIESSDTSTNVSRTQAEDAYVIIAGDENLIPDKNTIVGGNGDDTIDLLSSYSENLIQYTEGDGNDLIRGFGYDDTLLIGDGNDTYSTAKSGSDIIVTVGDGKITLKGAASLSNPSIVGKEISGATWKLNGSTATYSNLIKVTGVKSLDGITFDGNKTVTLSEDALNEETVTITKGYTLKINKSVPTSSTKTKSSWTEGDDGFTYTAPITSAFYTIKGNTLNYTAKKGGEQFTLTGLKNTNAVTVSGKKVTIGNVSLDGKAVTLTGDYTLTLAKDVTTSAKKTAGAFTTVSKGTATYKTTSFSGYYKVSGKKISYTAASGGQSITIKNLNTATKLSALKSGVTVAEQSNGSYKITFKNSAVLTTKAPTVSAAKGLKYTVAVADSLKPVTKSAWSVSGTTATFRTNTTAGYTVKNNAIVYSASKTGSPFLELTGLAKGVKASSIAAPKGKVITLKADVLGKNASLKSNSGGYTLNLTGNMSGKKFTGTGKVDTLTVAANNANVDSGAGNDVVTVSGLKVTLNGGAGNDKLTGSKNVDLIYGGAGNDSILGNAANDKLYGDTGNDTLRGGAGNDTLTGGKGDDQLWGDAGKDTFLYSNGDGKDVIYGFETGDLLQITGTFSASYNKSKKEIAFKVGSTANAITLKDFTATSFHINGDTYGISGTKLVKK